MLLVHRPRFAPRDLIIWILPIKVTLQGMPIPLQGPGPPSPPFKASRSQTGIQSQPGPGGQV